MNQGSLSFEENPTWFGILSMRLVREDSVKTKEASGDSLLIEFLSSSPDKPIALSLLIIF